MKLLKSLLNPVVIVLLVVVLVGLGAAGYFFIQYQNTQKELSDLKNNPKALATNETKKLVEDVGKLVELPNENPTIATVTDSKKLNTQAFFSKSVNGDKVLIYTEAKKAILYRPSTNKIIEVAPVNLGNQKEEVAGTATETLRVALYNGTTTVGLTNTIEKQLTESLESIEVVAKANAAKNDYEKTIVVDLSGSMRDQAGQIAKSINGTVGSLPEGEKKPEADILIILGQK
jgi:hypothetical protein